MNAKKTPAPEVEAEAPENAAMTPEQLAEIRQALDELDPVTGKYEARESWRAMAADHANSDLTLPAPPPLKFMGLEVRAPDGRPETYLENWLNAARRLLRREGFNV